MAQFLATSSSRPAAERFVTRAADTLDADGDGEANLTVLWTIELDRQQRCLHVNRLTETHVEEEVEFLFLFAAFSVFPRPSRRGVVGHADGRGDAAPDHHSRGGGTRAQHEDLPPAARHGTRIF